MTKSVQANISRSFIHVFNIVILVLAIIIVGGGDAYNLSPKPNIVFREPITNLKTGMPKLRSSYFGFSINLKRNR